MNIQGFITKVRLMEIDHDPDGWAAIQMREVSALVDAIEELQLEKSNLYSLWNSAEERSASDNELIWYTRIGEE